MLGEAIRIGKAPLLHVCLCLQGYCTGSKQHKISLEQTQSEDSPIPHDSTDTDHSKFVAQRLAYHEPFSHCRELDLAHSHADAQLLTHKIMIMHMI